MRRRLPRILLAATLVLVLSMVIANVYIVRVTAADIVPLAEAPHRAVAIVLGNRVYPDGRLSTDLHSRVETARALYQAGKVERIFLSGAAAPATGYDEPAEMATWLERHGVPRSALILDAEGYRTAATMENAARLGLRDVLVCTQDYHMPRALYFARHAGLRAKGVPPAAPLGVLQTAVVLLREAPARTEALFEVALRGRRAE